MKQRFFTVIASVLGGLTVVALCGTLIASSAKTSNRVSAGPAQTAFVRVLPADRTVSVGDTFTTSVDIQGANDLGAFQFALLYNRTVVTVTSAAVGPFLGSTGRNTLSLGPSFSNTSTMTTSVTMGEVSFAQGVTGAIGGGTLSVITFTANAPGTTALQLTDIKLSNTAVTPQPETHEDGQLTVKVAGTIPAPTATPVQLFLPLIRKAPPLE